MKRLDNLVACYNYDSRSTMLVCLSVPPESAKEMAFSPGDHVGIFACNRNEIVESILEKLSNCPVADMPIQLQNLVEKVTVNGQWNAYLEELCI